jgi:hypothetical protein
MRRDCNSELRDILRAECSVALNHFLLEYPQDADRFLLWCTAFFAGVNVMSLPTRPLKDVEEELQNTRREVSRILWKEKNHERA